MPRLINLTPHVINIHDADGVHVLSVQPEATPARCSVSSQDVNSLSGDFDGSIPVYRTVFGAVSGLPDPQPDTVYIVSMLVRQAHPERKDIASPGELIRNENGQPIGCRGLVIN